MLEQMKRIPTFNINEIYKQQKGQWSNFFSDLGLKEVTECFRVKDGQGNLTSLLFKEIFSPLSHPQTLSASNSI